MTAEILYPSADDLSELSHRVGGMVTARYAFDASDQAGAEKTAIQIATGQTLGFLPDNIEEYRDFVGRVKAVFFAQGRATVDISFPARLFGYDMAGLLTVLFGKISFYPNLKLESITADAQYSCSLKGGRFGLSGIRRLIGKGDTNRPLLMAILKPGMGPSDHALAKQFATLISAGTDLVKDDETRVDVTLEDALRRLDCVLSASKGRGLYVTHLTGQAFDLKYRAKKLQANGAQAFLFCPYTYGVSLLQSLCQDPEIQVPIFAHPAFTGPLTSGQSAVSAKVALGTLLRWAGCDAVLYPSPYGSIALPKQVALDVHKALTTEDENLNVAASVPSAGITPELVASIREDFGTHVIINAGTGMSRAGGGVDQGARAFLKEIERYFS